VNEWEDLSDSELRVRLRRRGVPDEVAVALVEHRDDAERPEAAAMIDEVLG